MQENGVAVVSRSGGESPWGDALRRQREAASLTQDGLARLLSNSGMVTAMTSVSRWETGKSVPPAHRRMVIDRVLAKALHEVAKLQPEAIHTVTPLPGLSAEDRMLDEVRALYAVTEGEGPYWKMLEDTMAQIRGAIRGKMPLPKGRKEV